MCIFSSSRNCCNIKIVHSNLYCSWTLKETLPNVMCVLYGIARATKWHLPQCNFFVRLQFEWIDRLIWYLSVSKCAMECVMKFKRLLSRWVSFYHRARNQEFVECRPQTITRNRRKKICILSKEADVFHLSCYANTLLHSSSLSLKLHVVLHVSHEKLHSNSVECGCC